jgi:anhydro-N-acetylmuramic acid kinase
MFKKSDLYVIRLFTMKNEKVYTAIGLMSGTSLDGDIDVALIETDGEAYVKRLDFKPFPYQAAVRDKVRACFGRRGADAQTAEADALVTDLHIAAVKALGKPADIIGFHGQTIMHDPASKFTWQLGDGQRLAHETGIDVVAGMRYADVAAGGQGAPLLPLYHCALASGLKKPLAVLNLGGVANVTWLGEKAGDILAFDCGPANALLDDFIRVRTGDEYDDDGKLAMRGHIHNDILMRWLGHDYFAKTPPKSLDRHDFKVEEVAGLSTEDGAATLTAFTVQAVAKAQEHFPTPVLRWLVTGGGRKNKKMIHDLKNHLGVAVDAVEKEGWNGDAMEAEGFAYLAVRSLKGLPLSLPSTTGVPVPTPGGVLYKA